LKVDKIINDIKTFATAMDKHTSYKIPTPLQSLKFAIGEMGEAIQASAYEGTDLFKHRQQEAVVDELMDALYMVYLVFGKDVISGISPRMCKSERFQGELLLSMLNYHLAEAYIERYDVKKIRKHLIDFLWTLERDDTQRHLRKRLIYRFCKVVKKQDMTFLDWMSLADKALPFCESGEYSDLLKEGMFGKEQIDGKTKKAYKEAHCRKR